MSLTPTQLETLRWIAGYIAERGYSPSFGDLKKAFDVQTSAIFDRLGILARKGMIERAPKIARSIRLTPLGTKTLRSGTTIDRTSPSVGGQRPSTVASPSEGEQT